MLVNICSSIIISSYRHGEEPATFIQSLAAIEPRSLIWIMDLAHVYDIARNLYWLDNWLGLLFARNFYVRRDSMCILYLNEVNKNIV